MPSSIIPLKNKIPKKFDCPIENRVTKIVD